MLSPQWMPDGESIVLSGLSESGVSDLYRVHLPEGTLEPLTADRYQDLDPTPRPTAGASSSPPTGRRWSARARPISIMLNLDSARIAPLTAGAGRTRRRPGRRTGGSTSPPTATACSTCSRWTRWATGRRETSAWSGAFDGVPLPDGSGLLVGGFHDLSWNLYRYPVDTMARKERFALEAAGHGGSWSWLAAGDTAGSVIASREPYRSRLTLDFAAGDAVIIPGYGGAQGAFFVMSDLLGDNLRLRLARLVPGPPARQHPLQHQRQRVYLNRSRRVNWGVGRLPHQGPELRGRPGRRLRRDRLRRARHHPLSAQPVQPDRRDLHRGALRPGRFHPAGGSAPPGGLDRDPPAELRPRQLALDQQRSDRRRPVEPHRAASPTTSATAGSTATW